MFETKKCRCLAYGGWGTSHALYDYHQFLHSQGRPHEYSRSELDVRSAVSLRIFQYTPHNSRLLLSWSRPCCGTKSPRTFLSLSENRSSAVLIPLSNITRMFEFCLLFPLGKQVSTCRRLPQEFCSLEKTFLLTLFLRAGLRSLGQHYVQRFLTTRLFWIAQLHVFKLTGSFSENCVLPSLSTIGTLLTSVTLPGAKSTYLVCEAWQITRLATLRSVSHSRSAESAATYRHVSKVYTVSNLPWQVMWVQSCYALAE
jgi:hypothetical protein